MLRVLYHVTIGTNFKLLSMKSLDFFIPTGFLIEYQP